MKDLCMQCTLEKNPTAKTNGLANQITSQQYRQGLVIKSLCDNCGLIYVDHRGRRRSKRGIS